MKSLNYKIAFYHIVSRVKIDDKMTTTESITLPTVVTMEDEDNIIFLDHDEDGQDAGLMFSPVIAEPELHHDPPPGQREELSSDYNNMAPSLELGPLMLTGLAMAALRS